VTNFVEGGQSPNVHSNVSTNVHSNVSTNVHSNVTPNVHINVPSEHGKVSTNVQSNVSTHSTTPSGSHTTTPGGSNKERVFGDLVIDGNEHVGDAYILKVSNFCCELNEIVIEIHDNGNELYMKRVVYTGEIWKDLICRLKLPVQVNEKNITCTYNREFKNGQLTARLTSQGTDEIVGIVNVCKFDIEADPTSTMQNIELNIEQTDDTFEFSPKNKMNVRASVSVVLENKTLLYDVKFETLSQTVTKSRKITLPIPFLGSSQVVTQDCPLGKKVVVHKKPTMSGVIPDTVIPVTLA